ncbi:MAG: hypothetical protein WCC48_15865 [Anaeromyxobacteraceae bacterium]
MSADLRLPPLGALLLRTRRDALKAFQTAGWRPWAVPFDLDAERRRTLNLDLAEPEVSLGGGSGPMAVAHVEADRDGLVTLVEITTAEPADPGGVARALLGATGEPLVHGSASAREWVWGPESGSAVQVAGEPVRLWIAAEQSYGDRLWIVLSVVRRASSDDD